MPRKKPPNLIEAFRAVLHALAPLDDEQRRRVLCAAAALFDLDVSRAVRPLSFAEVGLQVSAEKQANQAGYVAIESWGERGRSGDGVA